eukprot:366013-Chlamydomonas_euryale.AAC.5
MALFHQQGGVAVALGRNGRKVNIFVSNMPRSAFGHGRLLSVQPIAASFVVSRRSNGDTDGRRHGRIYTGARLSLGACWALVGRLALASGRNAAAVPAMPACMPAARGRKRRHTVAASRAGGDAPPLPPPPLSMARLALGMQGGRPNRVSSVRWNSVVPFLVWTAAPHGALALWNRPLSRKVSCHIATHHQPHTCRPASLATSLLHHQP